MSHFGDSLGCPVITEAIAKTAQLLTQFFNFDKPLVHFDKYSPETISMKIFTILLFVLALALTTGRLSAQEVSSDQPYTIQTTETETSKGGTIFTKTYFRNGKRDLTYSSSVTSSGQERVKSWGFSSLNIMRKLATSDGESDLNRMLFERGFSVFGWYGQKDKSMFDTIYSAASVRAYSGDRKNIHEVDNLLVRNKLGDYRLLDQASLDTVKAKGIIATIENRIGQPLVRKQGIVVSQKFYGRDRDAPPAHCHEIVVDLGPDGEEKRYTFFGSELGFNFKILEWTVNSKSKFSWINSETGFGSFMFQDGDGDGVYETLELVIDDKENVEIFDVSDPWDISLVPLDSDLFKDANESKARADAIRKAMQESGDQGLLEYSEDGKLITE